MNTTNTLTVKNFGPIKHTTVAFNRVTILVGPQGAGKSTLAKLYSTFSWLEKQLVRGLTSIEYITLYSRFKNKYCGYHRITSYFNEHTEIYYHGNAYDFSFCNDKLRVTHGNKTKEARVTKVMYIPAERNLLSSLGEKAPIRTLPPSLLTFKEEYESALVAISGYILPIGDSRFEYDRLNKVAWISGPDYRVRLTDASSGFQAASPMLIVTRYLTNIISRQHNTSGVSLSIDELKVLKTEVLRLMNTPGLSDEVRDAALASISQRFAYSGLINVVEEPEENLFPDSQRSVLYSLLSMTNETPGNKLIITTHSPYLINYITLAIKASELLDQGASREDISRVVPVDSCVRAEDVSIYQLSYGKADKLDMPAGLPSDNNLLNTAISDTNSDFDSLIEIEDGLQYN